jgi:hypothetical protein
LSDAPPITTWPIASFSSIRQSSRRRQSKLPDALGPSLVVTAITRDENLIQRLIGCPHIDRLNIGPIPTYQVKWDQPHEGNLFDHLYSRRAFQSSFEAA